MIRLQIPVQLYEMLLEICFESFHPSFIVKSSFLLPVLFAGLSKVRVLFEKLALFEGFFSDKLRSQ